VPKKLKGELFKEEEIIYPS